MNEMITQSTSRGGAALSLRPRGQSAVEFAMIASIVLLVLLAVADFGRMFYVSVALNNAARAGAQYGSQSLITAADSSGMVTAVDNDATNVTNLSTPTTSLCGCASSLPANVTNTCPSSYCTNNPDAIYVTVTASAPFNTITKYPGVPSSTTLSGTAIMQVQQ
jgi:Flp pilus assembly protein TadG